MEFKITPKLDSNFAFQIWKHQNDIREAKEDIRPIVTISREYGCGGYDLAIALAHRLSDTEQQPWVIFGKAIQGETDDQEKLRATLLRELHMDDRGTFEQFLNQAMIKEPTNFSRYKAICDEMKLAAHRGHAVIVGSAGAYHFKNRPHTFNIRLVGSDNFKISRLMRKYGFDEKEANGVLKHGRTARQNFYSEFIKTDLNTPSWYHIVLNNDHFTAEEMADWLVPIIAEHVTRVKDS